MFLNKKGDILLRKTRAELFLKIGEVLGYVFLLFGMTTIIGRKR